MHPGIILRKELQERGFFLKFVAKKTGIPYGTLAHYLAGHRPIPESKIKLICLSFDIPLKIFGLDVENNSHKSDENKETA